MEKLDPIAQQAIQWMVLLNSGEATPSQFEEFTGWRAQNAAHENACLMVERVLGVVPRLAASAELKDAVMHRSSRRQFLRNTLSVFAVSALAGLIFNRYVPIHGIGADVQTSTGERKSRTFGDGTKLTLNARTIVDCDFRPGHRLVNLRQGLIYLNVQAANTELVVQTPSSEVHISSGSLVVGVRPSGTRVAVLSNDALLSWGPDKHLELSAGQGGILDATSVSKVQVNPAAESAWLHGVVEVSDQPLLSLIDALRDYRSGFISLDPAIAHLRVSGMFSLDDTDDALETLEQTFPVSIHRRTDYWVSITARA